MTGNWSLKKKKKSERKDPGKWSNFSTNIPVWGSFKLIVNSSGHIQIPVKSIQRLSWTRIPGYWACKYPVQCNLDVTWLQNLRDCNKSATPDVHSSILPQSQGKIQHESLSTIRTGNAWETHVTRHTSAIQLLLLVCSNPRSSSAAIFNPFFVGCPMVGSSSIFSLVPEQARRVTDFWMLSVKAQKVRLCRKSDMAKVKLRTIL